MPVKTAFYKKDLQLQYVHKTFAQMTKNFNFLNTIELGRIMHAHDLLLFYIDLYKNNLAITDNFEHKSTVQRIINECIKNRSPFTIYDFKKACPSYKW